MWQINAARSLDRDKLQYRKLTSEPDGFYNCIAWAVDDKKKWWWPNGSRYWPNIRKGEQRLPTRQEFIKTFESLGYALTTNRGVEPELTKIAFYELHGEVKHAARQLANGYWTSKCGKNADIEHSLDQLEGDCYGYVTFVMSKLTTGTTETAPSSPT